MRPGRDKKTTSLGDRGPAAGSSTVRTFGLSHRERAPLVFVETSRGRMADEAFFLICGQSARGRELFQAAIAEFKRGSDIRPPEEYMKLLRETALSMEGGRLEQRVSFAAAWVRAGLCHWLTAGSYVLAHVSRENNVLRLPGESGKESLADMDRVVVAERTHFDEIEDALRQRRERGDPAEILHRLSQERRLTGALVLEHRVPRRGEATGKPASLELGVGTGSRLRFPRARPRVKLAWVFGLLALAAAAVLIVKWPLGGRSEEGLVEEVAEPREVSAVAVGTRARDSSAVGASRRVTLSPVWRKKFGAAVTSSPRVVRDRVYFGCRDAHVYCLDAKTGREVWKCAVGSGVGASPAVDDGRVYVGSYDGTFWCIDASSGNTLWRFRSGGRVVSSAAVSSGSVVFGSYDRNLYCLSAKDGGLRWRLETGGLVWSSPLVERERCYVGSADGVFYCVSLVSGEVRWKYQAGGPVYSSPGGGGSFVCCGCNSGAVFVLDARTGKELSRTEAGREVRSTILVDGGNAYVGADDGWVRCMRVSDGAAVWTFKTGGATRSGPALWDGLLFVTSYDGKLHVIDVVTGGEVGAFDTHSQIYSSPAVAGGRVYFGTNDGQFVCLEVSREGGPD
ncbi:MAG: PQQ-binding-like beta-propeller repeat protein [Candidatus Eisenbacteria bacterium]|nr:PQQ-binding-like beta-propeller repeat protein [Candidatus Eisenbacteria bacterium]